MGRGEMEGEGVNERQGWVKKKERDKERGNKS